MESEGIFESDVDLSEAEIFLQGLLPHAGHKLKVYFKQRDFSKIEKAGVDFTTEADIEVDELLRREISAKYPAHQFLTEETAPKDYSRLEDEVNLWIIDPLDGIINFSRGIPHFAISVALMQEGEVALGAVYISVADRFYLAREDKDYAFVNGQKIHVSQTDELREVVLGCDWGWDLEKRKNVVDWLGKVSGQIRQVASRGSAVADLASLAEGKMDVYFHSGLKPWDTAAAGLIIQKAGGRVTDVDGNNWSPFDKEILASNGILHERFIELIGPNPVKY